MEFLFTRNGFSKIFGSNPVSEPDKWLCYYEMALEINFYKLQGPLLLPWINFDPIMDK